jgi:hypothetical protein
LFARLPWGFAPGRELQDWIEAEAEVLRLIDNA